MGKKMFVRSHYACPCGCGRDAVDFELLQAIKDAEGYFGSLAIISSANRCPEHNAKVGGALNSMHLISKAVDFTVKGVSPAILYSYLNSRFFDKYGIGLYAKHVHLDVRQDKARWVE